MTWSKQDESLQPFGKLRATTADGREIELETSWYRYRYGSPAVFPWSGGLMQVQGTAPDLTGSYFLDREFWQGLEHRYHWSVFQSPQAR